MILENEMIHGSFAQSRQTSALRCRRPSTRPKDRPSAEVLLMNEPPRPVGEWDLMHRDYRAVQPIAGVGHRLEFQERVARDQPMV